MMDFPGDIYIPLAEWADSALKWLLFHWKPFFGAINTGVLFLLSYVESFFLWLPWWSVPLIAGLAAWRVIRLWWGGLLIALLMFATGALGYWEPTMFLLAIVASAVIIALVLGLPAGIIMARSDFLEKVLSPVLDFMHRAPVFIFLVLALVFFGTGKAPALIATVVYAAPPLIRLTSSGIRQSPASIVEAA